MQCPLCHGPLNEESLEGQTAQRCPQCSGVWLAETGLGRVARQMAAPKLTGREGRSGAAGLHCPACAAPMRLLEYAHDSGVLVNKCESCSGVWLAHGQLELIAKYRLGTPATEALGSALAAEMQTAGRWRRVRGVVRSRLLSGAVAAAYVLLCIALGNPRGMLWLAVFLPLPLACVWFCDGMGNLTGIALGLARPVITEKTPGDFVAIGGWVLLLCPLIVLLLALT